MKKDVYISIKGSQDYGDDKNGMEITTAGTFYDKDGKYYISYNEGYKDKSFYTLFLFALMPVMIFYDIILVVILWRFCL